MQTEPLWRWYLKNSVTIPDRFQGLAGDGRGQRGDPGTAVSGRALRYLIGSSGTSGGRRGLPGRRGGLIGNGIGARTGSQVAEQGRTSALPGGADQQGHSRETERAVVPGAPQGSNWAYS